jgi:hypothetical protein
MAKKTQESTGRLTAQKQKEKLIDELLKDYDGPESFWGESGLFAQLKKQIIERALDAEMDNHLGYSKHDPKGNNSGNSRNGRGKKSVVIDSDEVQLTPPCDRNGEFEPQLIPKRQKYFDCTNALKPAQPKLMAYLFLTALQFGGTILLSLSLISQDRYAESSNR